MRRLDARDVIRLADARHVLRNIGPRCATVFTELNVAVVSSNPEYSRQFRRLSNSHDVTVTGVAVVLRGHRILAGHAHDRECAAIDLLAQIDRCRPRLAAIHRSKELVAARVDHSRIVWRKMNRRVPVETKHLIRGWWGNNVRRQVRAKPAAQSLRG